MSRRRIRSSGATVSSRFSRHSPIDPGPPTQEEFKSVSIQMSFEFHIPPVGCCENDTKEQYRQLCVREAWDSVEQEPEPRILRDLNSGHFGPETLPFYPKLGHLYEDRWNFAKPPAEPCGLLSWACPRHKPREQREGEQADWAPTAATGKEPQESAERLNPSSKAAQRPSLELCSRRSPCSH